MKLSEAFLEKCRARDHRALAQLHRQVFSLLMGVCRRYCYNEDEIRAAHNGAFLKIVHQLDKYHPHIPFAVWARRVTINYLIDEYRKHWKYRTYTTLPAQMPDNQSTHNIILDQEEAEWLEAALHHLPPTTRQVFNLYAMDGYSHEEIGKMLHISASTSRWHLAEARKKLSQVLGLQPAQKRKNHE